MVDAQQADLLVDRVAPRARFGYCAAQSSFGALEDKYSRSDRAISAFGHSLPVVCRRAGREVRFGPKTNQIPMPTRWRMLLALCNRAEEYDHAESIECVPRAQAGAVEQGQDHGGKAAAATQTVVDPDET